MASPSRAIEIKPAAAPADAQTAPTPTPANPAAAAPPAEELLSLPPSEAGDTAAKTPEELLSLPPTAEVPLVPQPAVEAPPVISGTAPAPAPQADPATASPPAPATGSAQSDAQATPQQEAFTLPNPLDIVGDADSTGFQPSYGSWQYSIMYPSTDITNLKNILALYERKGFIVEQAATPTEEVKPTVEDLYRKLQERPLPANMVFPSFKLRSIMYRGPKEWSVWLNNRHITNENNKTENEVFVIKVTGDYAEFAWIPTNAELLSAILQLRLLPEGSRPKISDTPQHRKALHKKSDGWLDKNTSVVHFILRPNQVFYAETFEVFEGTPNALAASMNRAIQLETEPNSSPITPENDPTKIIKDLQGQLENVEGQIGQQPSAEAPPAATPPQTSEQKAAEILDQKQNPKAQMMRTLGLGQ